MDGDILIVMRTDKNGKAYKGSQLYLQKIVNENPELLDSHISQAIKENIRIEWKSPLETENYKEYRDSVFLEKLGVKQQCDKVQPLNQFWPKKGSAWDALGVSDSKVFIIEAKAHLTELVTDPSKAGEESLNLIKNSIKEVQNYLEIETKYDWSKAFYQYANRISHLYYLRKCGIDAHLIFLYFTGDTKFNDEATQYGYECAEKIILNALGLEGKHKLSDYIHNIFIPVEEI